MGALSVDLGLMVPDPEDLGGGKAGEGRVGGDLDQPLGAHFLGDLLALGSGALIAPDDGTAQDFAFLIQHHQAVHLTGDAHALDIAAVHAALLDDGLDGAAGGVPPVSRLLLSPAVVLLIHGVFHGGAGHHMTFPVEQYGFGTAGAQVNTNQIFHYTSRPFSAPQKGGICQYNLLIIFPDFKGSVKGEGAFFHDFFSCGREEFVLF